MSKKIKVDIESKIYMGGLQVLGGLKLEVKSGEFVSILGKSGCGKSTMLKIVAGLDRDFEGQVFIGGKSINKIGGQCGIAFQEPRLLPWFNVRKNIEFGLNHVEPEVDSRVSDSLQMLGLREFVDCLPNALSGGMAQRVSLARALVNKPEVLLLDEPFCALDEMTKMSIQEQLKRILKRQRTTTIMVTHDVEEAVYLSDRVLVMSDRPGRIVKEFIIDKSKHRKRSDPELIKAGSKILSYLEEAV